MEGQLRWSLIPGDAGFMEICVDCGQSHPQTACGARGVPCIVPAALRLAVRGTGLEKTLESVGLG
jgi:hypothetical protein